MSTSRVDREKSGSSLEDSKLFPNLLTLKISFL